MPIVPKYTQGDIKRSFEKVIEVIIRKQIKTMQMLGEMCVTHAKSVPSDIGFMDDTGALRGSIGYMVFVDGIPVNKSFVAVRGNMEGVKAGESLAEKVGAKYKNGVCLVVTAGMNYAIHLEAKGRDVLTSAELLAKKELPVMVAELKKAINEVI